MSVTEALHALCAELAADGVPHPLAQPVTLAALWSDLVRLAGEDVPAAVRALVEAPTGIVAPEDAA
ncbi:MAG: hypothetical protein M3Q65_16630 [Chloroflexota bacterium]|nr:hypothetical protein [Chloroflexota bacterium]